MPTEPAAETGLAAFARRAREAFRAGTAPRFALLPESDGREVWDAESGRVAFSGTPAECTAFIRQNSVAAPPSHPDLSPLLTQGDEGERMYTRILLAWIGGAYWVNRSGAWWLNVPAGESVLGQRGCLFRYGIGETSNTKPWANYGLPDPLNDPAAAWELEHKHRLRVVPPEQDGDAWWLGFDDPHVGTCLYGDVSRARAAELAVLHKYADDERWAHLVRPLLERMER